MVKNKNNNSKRNKRYSNRTNKQVGKEATKKDCYKEEVKELHNDPNWYFLDENVANQASAFAFDRYLGVPNELNINYNALGGSTTYNYQVPAIMTYAMNPCPGDTQSVTTGINIAALKTFTVLSSMNAKTTNYAPQDITTLILALGEIVSMMEHIRRCFGVAFTYNARNRTLPLNILTAMGLDAQDFLSNIAQYRMDFNSLVTAFNKVPFLANIAYIHKCADMYQRIYMDSESPMAQLHILIPYSTWYFNEAYSDQGTGLDTMVIQQDTAVQMSSILPTVSNMIKALLESATLNFVYSDILNYANKTGAQLLFLDYLREDYAVVPEYNANFLLQMHNLIVTGEPIAEPTASGATKANDVSPNVNKNKVWYNPSFPAAFGSVLFVDMPTGNPTVVDRIEATRYLACSTPSGTTGEFRGTGLPDHYCVQIIIYNGSETKPSDGIKVTGNQYATPTASQYSNIVDIVRLVNLSQFDWHPIVLLYVDDGTPEFKPEASILGDLNFYTTVDVKWLTQVNDLTFQALFALR